MKKRITCLALAVVLMFSVIFPGAISVSAASDFRASDECIAVLKLEEGFSEKPYWDYAQYTVGYGSSCPSDMVDYYTEHGITEAEAETLLRNHLTNIERELNTRIVDKYKLTLNQNQFDALVMFSYNCGTGWTRETNGTFFNAIISGATGNDLIRAFALWCSAGGQIKTFLLRRRLCEANMYLNGVYSKVAPDNYCYVLYDANGGTTSPKSQGYDSNLTAAPFPVPTYTGYTFDGWYTSKNGGVKVTVLDASTKGATLYAHWIDGNGNVQEKEEPTVNVTVTATDVNLRKGPGTNYAKIGTANKGDKLTITETATGSGYNWGKYGEGWICLQYTNYDEALKQQQTQTPTTPAPTTPAPTQPAPTTPTPTTPAPTQPAPTTPAPTTPPVQETNKVMGTVNVNDWLRVRSGPSTGHSVVEYLKPKQRVEILEKKTVGATVWGRISTGWISLDYVILDKQESTGTSQETTKWTGTVQVSDFLRVRSGAGTGYSIAGYLKPNQKIEIFEKKTVGSTVWGRISSGWISLDYVKLDTATQSGGNNSGSNVTQTTSVTGTVKVNDWLRVRSGPGTSYSVAGYLKPNEKVTITEQKTVNGTVWGKISSGWISMDYVVVDKDGSTGNTGNTGSGSGNTKTVIADCLRVRSGPGTVNKIVGYVYYGAKVEITATSNYKGVIWGKISTGWISLEYVK